MNWTETRELLIAAGIAAGLPTQWLPAIDLSGANLSGANLSGANLSGADLSRADLSGADLRESGQIEENAYGVMFLYREGYYDDSAPQGPAKVIVAKHRDGETGQVDLFWRGATAEYANAMQVEL